MAKKKITSEPKEEEIKEENKEQIIITVSPTGTTVSNN